jgi:hypothetical protein
MPCCEFFSFDTRSIDSSAWLSILEQAATGCSRATIAKIAKRLKQAA